jgi:hypothetical protein
MTLSAAWLRAAAALGITPSPVSGLQRRRTRIRPLFVRGAPAPAPSRDRRPHRFDPQMLPGRWTHHSAEREVAHRWHVERGGVCGECRKEAA